VEHKGLIEQLYDLAVQMGPHLPLSFLNCPANSVHLNSDDSLTNTRIMITRSTIRLSISKVEWHACIAHMVDEQLQLCGTFEFVSYIITKMNVPGISPKSSTQNSGVW